MECNEKSQRKKNYTPQKPSLLKMSSNDEFSLLNCSSYHSVASSPALCPAPTFPAFCTVSEKSWGKGLGTRLIVLLIVVLGNNAFSLSTFVVLSYSQKYDPQKKPTYAEFCKLKVFSSRTFPPYGIKNVSRGNRLATCTKK